MAQHDQLSAHVKTLVKNLHTDNTADKVLLVSAAVELLRRARLVDHQAPHALVNFISKAASVPWEKVQFSVTQAVMQRGKDIVCQYAPNVDDTAQAEILLDAVALFVDILADAPDEATLEVFDAVIAELADNRQRAPAAVVPEIFQPRTVERCFDAKPVTATLLNTLGLQFVLYRGRAGAQHRGLLLGSEKNQYVVLETGEVVAGVAPESCTPVLHEDEFASMPAVLLAYLVALTPDFFELGAIIEDVFNAIVLDAKLGVFKDGVVSTSLTSGCLLSLQQVFDMAAECSKLGITGASGPVGTVVRRPITDDLCVHIRAAIDTGGAYTTAKLTHGETVRMRHDKPRENSPHGVYLFPLLDQTIVLKVF